MKQYDVVYADPPWFYSAGLGPSGTNGGYPMMRPEELRTLGVSEVCAPDCMLFLWTTSPKLAEAIQLGEAWGFKYITVAFVWDKQQPVWGQYSMSQVELCLLFRRGAVPKPWGARNVRQFLSQRRTAHSEKPAEIRDRIVALFPKARRIELFARHKIKGWDRWGNEVACSVRIKSGVPK